MTAAVLPALIAALASLIVAVISVVVTTRTTRRVAQLTAEVERQKLYLASELAEQKAVRDARRDYEYEAKKRLYAQCEPLIFQAVELAELGRRRVLSLARTCRQGNLRPDGTGWLSRPGYYFLSTSYFLLAPMTSVKILQRHLTAVDLGLEPQLRAEYEILKLLFASFTEDHALAALPPPLAYRPDMADPGMPGRGRLLREEPETYRRQGFYLGKLEVVAEALITTESVGEDPAARVAGSRCKTFGEFEAEWAKADSPISAVAPAVSELFTGFHPQARPALWRVLITQYLLYEAFLSVHGRGWDEESRFANLARKPSPAQVAQLDWRSDAGEAPDEAIRSAFVAAHAHLRGKLTDVDRTLGTDRSRP